MVDRGREMLVESALREGRRVAPSALSRLRLWPWEKSGSESSEGLRETIHCTFILAFYLHCVKSIYFSNIASALHALHTHPALW